MFDCCVLLSFYPYISCSIIFSISYYYWSCFGRFGSLFGVVFLFVFLYRLLLTRPFGLDLKLCVSGPSLPHRSFLTLF